MSEKNFDFNPDMNDAKNQTDNSFGDSFGNKPDDDSKNKQDNSGDPIRDRYKKNQEDINTSFTNDQNDDFNNEKKNNSSSTQNKRSKKSNTQNNLKDKVKDHYEKNQENINKEFEDKNGKQGKEETDTEREYKQTKAAYNKMREANTDRAKKMAEKLKEKMKYYENKIKKEKEESVNNEKQKSSEKSEKKTNSEQKQETKKTTEELKQEVEKTFKKLLEAEGDLGKTKNDRGLFRETQAWFGIGKTKEGHINKDFEIKKEIAKKIKEEYRVKYNEFARKLEKEERNKMKKEGKSEATINELIGLWALVDPTISVKEKKVNGTEEEKKVSLFEYMNRNEKKILKKRQEVLSEKEKGLARRLLEKYNNLSKTKKLIYGTVISSVIGATIVLAGGAALSTALGYGAWRGGKTLFRRSTTGALSGVAIKGANAGLTKRVESKKITDFEEAKFDFEKRFKDKKTDIFSVVDGYNEKIRKRDRNRKITAGVIAGALFGTAIGWEALASGEVSADSDSINVSDKTEAGDFYKTKPFYKNEVPINEEVDESLKRGGDVYEKETPIDDKGNKGIADKDNEDKNYKVAHEANQDAGSRTEPNSAMMGRLAEMANNNQDFHLAKDGNVWNSLSEHFDGDKQQVAQALAVFREETIEDLMENQGMSSAEANQFIEWRYRHMDIGTEFELKNGKLEIPDFDDKGKIASFERQNLSENESFSNKKSIPPTSREDFDVDASSTVEVSEPRKTVEILDPKISAEIDRLVENLKNQIYGRQSYEWDIMKDKNVEDVIRGEYGNPIKEGVDGIGYEVNEVIESERGDIADNGLDQAEINNRKELSQYLIGAMKDSGLQPEANETVEEFMRRVEMKRLGVAGDNFIQQEVEIPGPGAEVEVLEPDSTENVPDAEGIQQYQVGLEENLNKYFSNWEGLKNNNTWDELSSGSSEMKSYLRDLIEKSKSVPSSDESLNDFVKTAETRTAGYEVPFSSPTEVDQALSRVFNFDDQRALDEWIKMREYKPQVIMDGSADSTVNLDDRGYWRNMSFQLRGLASDSGLNPNPGENVEEYITRATRSLKN